MDKRGKGFRGRKKPSFLRVLDGNRDHVTKAKANRSREPQPKRPARVPSAPTWLDHVAKAEWKRLAAALHEIGLLTAVDKTAFAAYCNAYSLLKHCVEHRQKHGVTMEVSVGKGETKTVRTPESVMEREASATLARFIADMGLTPAARSKIEVEKKPTGEDVLAAMLEG